jgi:hypothetical protein
MCSTYRTAGVDAESVNEREKGGDANQRIKQLHGVHAGL